MHPEEETVHPLNVQVVRAESERLTSEALVMGSTPVRAVTVGTPTGLPQRHRRMSWAARQWARHFGVAS